MHTPHSEGRERSRQFVSAAPVNPWLVPQRPLHAASSSLQVRACADALSLNHLEIVNVIRDDLFKVVFTKNGTLYVVTTLPEYEAWLTDILTAWQFTD